MNTHESYVSLETAKLLKQAGFNWKCRKCYNKGVLFDMEADEIRAQVPQHSSYDVSAPTITTAQKWLREVKSVWVEVLLVNSTDPHYRVDLVNASRHNNPYGILHDVDYKAYETPEQAQEAGIRKALEIILEKGK